jgi:hypothetical protein
MIKYKKKFTFIFTLIEGSFRNHCGEVLIQRVIQFIGKLSLIIAFIVFKNTFTVFCVYVL